MNKDFWLAGIWEEGICVDFWSVNHFLGGMILGYFSLVFNINFWVGLVFASLIIVGWEAYELLQNIEELPCNKFFDIFLGIAGFLILALEWLNFNHYFFGIVLITFVFLELWGFYGYKYRKKVK